jgi:hypothetical protein
MTFTRVAALTTLLLCCAGPAGAQVNLEFHDGLVNLTTQNAPLRAILAEWARLGGTQVVNLERLAGSPVTLQLTNVPETQALDIILRGTAGYIAGQRTSVAATNQSSLDRIMVVPTAGTAPPAVASRPAATPPPFQQTPQPSFQQTPQPFAQANPDDDPPDAPDDERPNRVNRPGVPPAVLRMVGPNGQAVPQPYVIDDDTPQVPAPAPTTAPNPFGVTTGAARPGMPPPQPTPPQQRPPNTRDPEP